MQALKGMGLIAFFQVSHPLSDSLQILLDKAKTLCELKRYAEAISCYEEAILLQPNFYQAWYERGQLLYQLERYEDAIASFDKAIQIQPNFDVAIENRKQALSQIHQNSQTTCGVFGGYPCQGQ